MLNFFKKWFEQSTESSSSANIFEKAQILKHSDKQQNIPKIKAAKLEINKKNQ